MSSYEHWTNVVSVNGIELEAAPSCYIDYDLCFAAVSSYGGALDFVPIQFRDKKMCDAAVNEYPKALKYVPRQLRTKEMCLRCVKENPWTYYDCPDKKDEDVAWEAVKGKSTNLRYVYKQWPELVYMAIKKFPNSVQWVSDEMAVHPDLADLIEEYRSNI